MAGTGVEYTLLCHMAPIPERQASKCRAWDMRFLEDGGAIEMGQKFFERCQILEKTCRKINLFLMAVPKKFQHPVDKYPSRNNTLVEVD